MPIEEKKTLGTSITSVAAIHPMVSAVQAPSVHPMQRPGGGVNVAEPAALYIANVAADRAVFEQLGVIHSFPDNHGNVAYSLAQWQTPIRDQKDRGTCYAFASIAALEAMYKRTFGLDLDLSEQYAFQVGKIGELYPSYLTDTIQHESNCTYWGGQGNSGFLNVISRVAVPLETEAPYMDQEALEALRVALGLPALDDFNTATQETIDTFEFSQDVATPNVPTAARSNAIYRGTGYTPINYATSDIENAISADHEVVLDISTAWTQNGSGVFEYSADAVAGAQGHTVLVVGFDRGAQIFTFKNSWGGSGLSQMSYDCLTHIAAGATTLNGAVDPKTGPQVSARWLGNWDSDHDGWTGKLTIRRVTNFRDSSATDPTKLGDWYAPDGTRRDVNGSLSENGQQANYWIAPDATKVAPGQPVGQPFNVDNFSWESTAAAGLTTWNNTKYGAILDRGSIPGTSGTSTSTDWIGVWDMDHDGWKGTLTITGFAPVLLGGINLQVLQASYVAADGTASAVTGTLDTGDQLHLTMTIAFAGNTQPFQLYRFSWQTDNAAGTTVWNGTTYGVRLHKHDLVVGRVIPEQATRTAQTHALVHH